MIESHKTTKYLDILQVFRGIAALMVVLHHSIGSINHYHNIDNYGLNLLQSIGKFGVDFFFILSGFIISYTAYFKKNNPKAFSNYVKNRLVRIYIPYLPIGVLMFLLYTYFPLFSNGSREISVLTSLTLFPSGSPALSVAWTLTYEIIFYILFSVYFISNRFWQIFSFSWVCLIIYFNWIFQSALPDIALIKCFLSVYNLEFILGTILSFFIIINFRFNLYFVRFMALFFAVYFFITYALSLDFIFNFYPNLLFSLFCFFLIYLFTAYKNDKFKSNNLWMLIGNATFSIYLLHNPIQMTIVRLFPKIQLELRILLMLLSCLIISCVCGYIYYLIFEVRMTNLVKKNLK